MRSLVPAYCFRDRRMHRLVSGVAIACALFMLPEAAAAQTEPAAANPTAGSSLNHEALQSGIFGALEVVVGRPEDIRQWDDFKRRYIGEKALLDKCVANSSDCPSPRAREWSGFLSRHDGRSRSEQIETINRYVNAIARHDSDARIFGIRDYWATPLEFLERTGDCEDFTILKFVSLLYLGVPNEEMRIVVALDRGRNIGHAVLAVQSGHDEEVLDTSYAEIWASAKIADYAPEYSLNLTTRWAHFPVSRSTQIFAQSNKAND
jgi:predicted transglutaminase-like cysteine proteinase